MFTSGFNVFFDNVPLFRYTFPEPGIYLCSKCEDKLCPGIKNERVYFILLPAYMILATSKKKQLDMKLPDPFKVPADSGYLLIPRKLLNRIISQNEREMSEEQAFLSLLTLVNYKNTKTCRGECDRGESVRQITEWSKIFNWPEWKTRRFFSKMEKSGEISFDRQKRPHTLRITHYEELCAHKKTTQEKPPKSLNDEQFDEFWQSYHEITRQIPVEQEATRREWNKLPLKERRPAVDGIGEYFMSLKDVRHVRKAVNYLKYRSFK